MRKNISFTYLVVLLLMLIEAGTAYSQAWVQEQGHGFYKLGVSVVRATRFYEPAGQVIDIPTLADYTGSLYGEYGLTRRLTVVAYIPFIERITLNRQEGRTSGFVFFEGDAVTGIADINAGLRIGLLQGGASVVSAGVTLGLPTGNTEQANGLLTGDGEFNQLLTLNAGHSFYPVPAYASATLGFNNRTNGFSDEVHYGIEAGYTFAARFTLIGRLVGLESRKNGDDTVQGGMGGLYANNQQYLSYGLEMAYTFGNIGLSFGVAGATRGQNVLSAPAFSTGIFLKR